MKPFRFLVLAIIASGSVLVSGQGPGRGGQTFGRGGQTPTEKSEPQEPRPAPQESIATFRAGVRAIQIDAVVTDEDGNPVRGLTIDDFEITERGKPQPITTFEAVDLPIETLVPDLADADVVTNEGDGRIYLVVIDSIRADNAAYAKRELRRFFDDHFGPGDTAAIMFLDRAHSTAGQDFTSNRRLLIKGLDSFVGYSDEDVGKEKVEAGSASPFSPGSDSSGSGLIARNRMERLKDLTEFLIKIPGHRKAMLLVSEAIGFDSSDFKDYAGTSMTPAAQAAHAALTAATRGNIAIYPIHPGGVSPNGPALAVTGESPTAAESDRLQGERLKLQEGTMELRTLAAATGGFAHVNSNNFDDSFTRLVQEQSVYYMLAFNSGEDNDNGRYVPVKVTVKRPGLKVLAREGYVAPFKGKDNVRPAERRPGVQSALASPIPVGGVTLRAFAAPFKGKGKTASVLVALEMDPQGLGLTELPDGGLRGAVDVRMVATDVRANVLPQVRQVGNISIPSKARADLEREGLHILTKTDLQPGRYQLRIAIGTAQRGGSVIYDLEVPDYSRKELTMSGVVLRGPNEPDGMFLPPGDPLQSLSIGAPTTARMFRSDDKVAVFAEIYDNTGGKPHTVDVKAEIRSETGEVTPVVTASRPSGDPRNGGDKNSGDIVRLETQLPLAKLMPGRYVLSVDVKSSAGGGTLTRSVPFRVR
jgi:VWFA-related protein